MNRLKEIFYLLQEGNIVQVNKGNLWVSRDYKYIYWRHFGQSANRNNQKELAWILKTILNVEDIDNVEYRIVNSTLA